MALHSPTPTAPRGTHSFWQPILWRGLAFAITYLAAVAGLLSGVGVTERNLAESGLAEVAYYSIGLFVLGGLDIGTPVGGPLFGRALLWSVYFIAPVITASALIEATVRLISPPGVTGAPPERSHRARRRRSAHPSLRPETPQPGSIAEHCRGRAKPEPSLVGRAPRIIPSRRRDR